MATPANAETSNLEWRTLGGGASALINTKTSNPAKKKKMNGHISDVFRAGNYNQADLEHALSSESILRELLPAICPSEFCVECDEFINVRPMHQVILDLIKTAREMERAGWATR